MAGQFIRTQPDVEPKPCDDVVLQADLAEYERAKQALIASKEQARGIIDTAYDAYIAIDENSIILEWNRQAEITFGWPRDEVLGKDMALIVIPTQHREAHRRGVQHFLASGEGPVLNQRIEITALRRDGHEFPVELTIWPTQIGETWQFNAFLHDISERQRAGRRLAAQTSAAAALVESPNLEVAAPKLLQAICTALNWSVGALWVVDVAGEAMHCADLWRIQDARLASFEQTTRSMEFRCGIGLPGRIWNTGKPAWMPDVVDDCNFPRSASAAEVGLHGAFGFPVVSDGGVVAVFEFSSSSSQQLDPELLGMMDTLGNLLGQFMVRQRAEESLSRQTVELARSNAELEQFAYVASHDLQEPLRMVASYTQLLAKRYKGKLDADADDFITYAVQGAQRMQGLIQALLAYSRAGNETVNITLVACEAILARTLANLDATIEEVSAEVTHDSLPMVVADELQLGQVFQNLISNALRYRRSAEGPRIHIAAVKQDREWLFSVRDNGIGIEPEYAERIFVIFKRLNQDLHGAGIGLTICKKIVQRHGGRIWVESAPGSGSIFYFTLPDTK